MTKVRSGDAGAVPRDAAAHPASRLPVEHADRFSLVNEIHARPFEALEVPLRASTYAMLTGEDSGAGDRAHLSALCQRFGVSPPSADANYYRADFGQFRLRWERHTEFTSYSFFRTAAAGSFRQAPFQRTVEGHVPADWLRTMPGELLVAAHVELLEPGAEEPDQELLSECFVAESLVSSELADGATRIWTDLRVHSDGHNRILIHCRDMPPRKTGRLAQRVMEIVSYLNLALLGLPVARETGIRLADIDKALALLTAEMARRTGLSPVERDHALLGRLTELSAEIEELAAATAYRFAATRAYYALLKERLTELRETRVDTFQTVSEFLERRLAPAMRTCESVSYRQADLSRRATRAANLLRTRVDFALERQNHKLLDSMDKRARLQLRLQQTVEGLSVVAISYYLIGLILYAAKAGKSVGLPFDPFLVAGVAVPIAIAAVWMFVRRLRRHIDAQSPADG